MRFALFDFLMFGSLSGQSRDAARKRIFSRLGGLFGLRCSIEWEQAYAWKPVTDAAGNRLEGAVMRRRRGDAFEYRALLPEEKRAQLEESAW